MTIIIDPICEDCGCCDFVWLYGREYGPGRFVCLACGWQMLEDG